MSEQALELTEDAFLGGRLHLRQPKSGHRAGHDAILLAAATPARPGERVVEFGAGVGAAGLGVARRVADIDLILVEIDSALAALARDNAAANAIAAQVLVLDATAPAQVFATLDLLPDSTDVVLMNPPFNDAARHRSSPDQARASAHMAGPGTLEQWIGSARRILKSGGVLTLIWRADELDRVLDVLGRGFGAVEVIPVYPKPDAAAIRVLVRAIKASRGPLQIFPGFVLNDRAGRPSEEAEHVLQGAALGSGICGETARGMPEK